MSSTTCITPITTPGGQVIPYNLAALYRVHTVLGAREKHDIVNGEGLPLILQAIYELHVNPGVHPKHGGPASRAQNISFAQLMHLAAADQLELKPATWMTTPGLSEGDGPGAETFVWTNPAAQPPENIWGEEITYYDRAA